MNIFPFNLEPSLCFYVVVYVLTLVLHAVFMTYVLAGSIYLAWAALFPGQAAIVRARSPLAEVLRDWMPFALSAAITAGVAPLLFVQIIYRQEFYTSNLLLGWRWMMVVPVLIVGFYLLYLVKSKLISQWSLMARGAVTVGVALCFLFVAFCWTTNHLLGIDAAAWPQAYETGAVVSSAVSLSLRLMTWVTGSFPSMCAFVIWQVSYYRRRAATGSFAEDSHFLQDVERLRRMALGGLLLTFICGTAYAATVETQVRSQLFGSGMVWFVCLIIGGTLQAFGWIRLSKQSGHSIAMNVVVSAGAICMLIGVGFLREILRISRVDIEVVNAGVKTASAVGGFELFIGFTILNIALMAYCIRLVGQRTDL